MEIGMNIKTASASGNKFIYLLSYAVGGIILFLPVLNKNFVSDDYVVLKRVCLEGTIGIYGFFRPLSDWSIYLNYLVSGFHPFGFNLVNILLHSVNSFLLFKFCLKWKWTSDDVLHHRYAFMASILFLTYPFHNEAIVWLLGRGSLLAGTFIIAALLIFLSGWNDRIKFFGVCACYFIGLLAYESIIILPLLIFILLTGNKASARTYLAWVMVFVITGIVHFFFRYNFSGGVFGKYEESLFRNSWLDYAANILKVTSRLIVPPIKNSFIFLIVSAMLSLTAIYVFFYKVIIIKKQIPYKHFVFQLTSIIGCTLIIPFLVALSTKTSEGDRLLYIPSFFLCCFISFILCVWIRSIFPGKLIFILACIYNVVFLELNNYNWFLAGKATCSILQSLKSDTTKKIFVANLPNEIKGAYIFREGFKDALIINGIDTLKVIVINKLSKELLTDINETWVPVYYKKKIFIPPLLEVRSGVQTTTILNRSGVMEYALPVDGKLYYWDQHKFVLLKAYAGLF